MTVLASVVILLVGCTRVEEVHTVSDDLAINTIPFYSKDSLVFDSKKALKLLENEKASKEADFQGKFKERVMSEGEVNIKMFDPWVPPPRPKSLPLAMQGFPKDKYGWPDWAAVIALGLIKPKDSLPGQTKDKEKEETFNGEITFKINDDFMANVIFPHKIHNEWLSCKICHPAIFKAKKGANLFTMYDIWAGKFCGRCHGKVAYPPKGWYNCNRCHRSRKGVTGFEDVLRKKR